MVVDGVVLVAVAAVLVALWWSATRRHVRRRAPERAEWDDDAGAPRLWTSTVACPACRAGGGLVSTEGGEVWFTCLSCGERHRRETKA